MVLNSWSVVQTRRAQCSIPLARLAPREGLESMVGGPNSTCTVEYILGKTGPVVGGPNWTGKLLYSLGKDDNSVQQALLRLGLRLVLRNAVSACYD